MHIDWLFWGCLAALVVSGVLLVRFHIAVWRATRGSGKRAGEVGDAETRQD